MRSVLAYDEGVYRGLDPLQKKGSCPRKVCTLLVGAYYFVRGRVCESRSSR